MNVVTLSGTSGVVTFRPRARLMKLIGGELVSDEVVAVTELVKNAYDADARTVHLHFKGVASGAGEIVIADDGHGMTLQDVADYWMQPGGTTKSGNSNRKSATGRRVLGEKGIGRFAADKLGTTLVLTTRKKGQDQEVLCSFDWSEFEHDGRMLSDVGCAWKIDTESTTVKRHGTILRIAGLRSRWNERLFRKLCLRLGRLRNPFGGSDKFKVMIESDEFPDYAGELAADYLDKAPHRINAQFDGDQTVRVIARDGSTESLTWNGEGTLDCGPVRVRLYGFDLETPALARLGPPREARAWLREWTGVSIYRDGFRLSPYGEPNDDWLRLDQRRVNNPVVRLSNNQVIGFVELGGQENPLLLDQTNREGMISNKAFDDLRRLVLFVINQLEASRQQARHPVERKASNGHESAAVQNSVAEDLDNLAAANKPISPAKLKAIARRVRDNADREERRMKAFADSYAELAAVGHLAEEAVRRTSAIIEKLDQGVTTLSQASGESARHLQRHLSSLRREMAMLHTIQSHHGSRRRTIDLKQELQRMTDAFGPSLEERGIRLELPENEALVRVEMRPENLHRVLLVLFRNSIDWLHRTKAPRIKIAVESRAMESHCAIDFSDNGPGIPAGIAERVFEPMESGREGGKGMGLTIARHIVEGSGGSMQVVRDGRRKGATIRILLPQKRTRALRAR